MRHNYYCLDCKKPFIINEAGSLYCVSCQREYKLISQIPVFIDSLESGQLMNKRYTDNIYMNKARAKKSMAYADENIIQPSDILANSFRIAGDFYRVLDLGCGEGQLSVSLLEANPDFAQEVVGLDISIRSLLSFKDNISRRKISGKISFLCSAAEKIFLPDQYFDAVICHKFIHHVELDKLLKELSRILKPGGYFMVFREPYLNHFETSVRKAYYGLLNLCSVLLKGGGYTSFGKSKVEGVSIKKYQYSRKSIDRMLVSSGFEKGHYFFSNFLYPFLKMILYPFILRFPQINPFYRAAIKISRKIDLYIFEKLIPSGLLGEVSFYTAKKAKL